MRGLWLLSLNAPYIAFSHKNIVYLHFYAYICILLIFGNKRKKIKNRNFMNNLRNLLALTIGVFVTAIIPVACTEEESEPVEDFNIKGKLFEYSYLNVEDGIHEAGTEILEFKSNDSVVRYNMFCILVGDYLQMSDYEEKGRYGVVGNAVMIGLGDSLATAAIYENNEGAPMLNWPNEGHYKLSELSVEGQRKQFERLHTHNRVEPIVRLGDSLLTVSENGRYLGCVDQKSFIINVSSVSGSHASNDQTVKFTIRNIPGEFVLSEASGFVYLMKFGSMAYSPVDKEMAESNPKDVVLTLKCDGTVDDYTLACPYLDKSFKGEKSHVMFATLNPKLY